MSDNATLPRASRPRASARRRWSQLPVQDKLAALEALALLGTVRVLLKVAPSALVAKALRHPIANAPLGVSFSAAATEADIRLIREAIRRASLRVRDATCLAQAVAAWIMLRRRGVRAAVRIGVQAESDGFLAHAWLCVGDRIVVGGEDAAVRFVTLEKPRG